MSAKKNTKCSDEFRHFPLFKIFIASRKDEAEILKLTTLGRVYADRVEKHEKDSANSLAKRFAVFASEVLIY
jgi:hypothetical protein